MGLLLNNVACHDPGKVKDDFIISFVTLIEIFTSCIRKGREGQELLKVFALPLQTVEFVRVRMTWIYHVNPESNKL
jgi:hypothetical protein